MLRLWLGGGCSVESDDAAVNNVTFVVAQSHRATDQGVGPGKVLQELEGAIKFDFTISVRDREDEPTPRWVLEGVRVSVVVRLEERVELFACLRRVTRRAQSALLVDCKGIGFVFNKTFEAAAHVNRLVGELSKLNGAVAKIRHFTDRVNGLCEILRGHVGDHRIRVLLGWRVPPIGLLGIRLLPH